MNGAYVKFSCLEGMRKEKLLDMLSLDAWWDEVHQMCNIPIVILWVIYYMKGYKRVVMYKIFSRHQ